MRISRAVVPSRLTTTRSYSWWTLLSSPILGTPFRYGRHLADGKGGPSGRKSTRSHSRHAARPARPITRNGLCGQHSGHQEAPAAWRPGGFHRGLLARVSSAGAGGGRARTAITGSELS